MSESIFDEIRRGQGVSEENWLATPILVSRVRVGDRVKVESGRFHGWGTVTAKTDLSGIEVRLESNNVTNVHWRDWVRVSQKLSAEIQQAEEAFAAAQRQADMAAAMQIALAADREKQRREALERDAYPEDDAGSEDAATTG